MGELLYEVCGVIPIARITRKMFTTAQSLERVRDHEGEEIDIETWFTDPYYLGSKTIPEYFYPNQCRIVKVFYQQNLTTQDKEWLNRLKSEGKCNWKCDEVYDTLILICGQRCGKSVIIAGLTTYEIRPWVESDNPWHDVPAGRGKTPIGAGAPVEIKQIATSQQNAKEHVFKETQEYIERSPYFQGKFDIDKLSKKMEINFPNNLTLMAGASSGKSIRGGTNLAVGFDEICHQTSTRTYVGGEEIYKALRNTTVSLGGKKLIISSPLTNDDQGMILLRQAMSGLMKGALAFHLSTFEVCPAMENDPDILKISVTDPEGFKRDFLAQPSGAIEPFFRMPDWLDKIFTLNPPGMIEQPREDAGLELEQKIYFKVIQHVLSSKYPVFRGCKYVLSVDPSETNDAFGLSLCHNSADKHHIDFDLVMRFVPPSKYGVGGEIDSSEIEPIVMALCRKFKPYYISDKFGWTSLRQSAKRVCPKVREINMDLGIAVNSRKGIYQPGPVAEGERGYEGEYVRCYYNPQLRKELLGLELLNEKRIEYPRKVGQCGHGDMAITVLQCINELYDPTKVSKMTGVEVPWAGTRTPVKRK